MSDNFQQIVRAVLLLFVLPAIADAQKLDVNDVSFLWPSPIQATTDGGEYLSLSEFLSQETFDKVIAEAEGVRVGDRPAEIRVSNRISTLDNWKIAGIRIDPAAISPLSPNAKPPQIRLVAQPVVDVRDFDFTMHVVFSFMKDGAVDSARAKKIGNELAEMKKWLKDKGIETDGPLNVHPGLKGDNSEFVAKLKTFISSHVSEDHLEGIAFMGIDSPEPWIFFVMIKHPTTGELFKPGPAQMISFRGFPHIVPDPDNLNWQGAKSVSTAPLFESFNQNDLVFEDDPSSLKFKDIPDFMANPELTHLINTKDCISCHSETTRREILRLDSSEFAFKLPEGVSGVHADVNPGADDWNVRNFGWFNGRPTVTKRTANEAAESVDIFNKMLASKPPVSNGLNLIMNIKEGHEDDLKNLIKVLGDNQDNKIRQAMRKLGTVHFARFVFVNDKQVAMITSYDGDFDAYIDAFANEIGPVFDRLFEHIEDTPPAPVEDDPEALAEFVNKYNKENASFFSVYPNLSAGEILRMEKERNER